MQVHFETPEFDSQLMRTLNYTYYQGADIGECLVTASQITGKNCDSWYEEWFKTAERIYADAQTSRNANNTISALQGFLRASNYYRTSICFLYSDQHDSRLMEAYDKHCVSFAQAVALFPNPIEPIRIPFENTELTGYFYQPDSSPHPRPTLIVSNGYDSTHQECYFIAGAAALARGYNVLCFDGPGQGHALIKQNLHMRHDWENVITPVIDFLIKKREVDQAKIALYGPSWGGYLAPRAAAFEHRLASVIVNPGQYDAMEPIKLAIPAVAQLLDNDPEHLLEKLLAQSLANPMFATKIQAKLWIHGIGTFIELLKTWKNYTLAGIAEKITAPTLVMDSENEPLSTGQAKHLFEALTCPKEYKLFTAKEGAGEHCEAGAISLSHQYLFDWLASKLDFAHST